MNRYNVLLYFVSVFVFFFLSLLEITAQIPVLIVVDSVNYVFLFFKGGYSFFSHSARLHGPIARTED